MTVTLKAEPPREDVEYIIANLRERDRAEIFATKWVDDDHSALVEAILHAGAFQWAAYLDGEPVAMIGATPRWPGVWSMWAFGTDKWPRVARRLTKHAKRFMFPALMNAGAIRADCYALETHADARRWLTALGAIEEQRLANWGKNGETFVCYCWLRKTPNDH